MRAAARCRCFSVPRRARQITLGLKAENGSLDLEVTNDGRSRAPRRPKQQGIGLQIMKSRSEAMGAVLQVRSLAPRGTLVRCSVPLAGAEGLVIRT